MPVWHARTRDLVAAGELQVIGIVQEQHPDRALLYQMWQELDWPLLWDPFNRTRSAAVPVPLLVDEHGVVRSVRARPEDLETFLATDYPAPESVPAIPLAAPKTLAEFDGWKGGTPEQAHGEALATLLWKQGDADARDAAVELLVADAAKEPANATLQFEAGVALRMRYDRDAERAADFQGALDHWAAALALDPNQYIWRRRIQQYGPRLDKPYPFYTWVEEAQSALRARGIEPPLLVAALSPAELMQPRREVVEAAHVAPPADAERITRDDGLVASEHAVAFHTDAKRRVAMVHLAFRPNAARAAHWNNEVEPLRVWLSDEGLPAGAALDAVRLEAELPAEATSDEVRRFAVELALPEGAEAATLRGFALFHACEGVDGACVYRRLDFEVPVKRR